MRPRLTPYLQLLRLDKPIGIWLLFYPAGWAVALSTTHDVLHLELLMLAGAVITRAAGCIVNDLTDRRLDAQVARTRTRPLAAGTVPAAHAYALLFLLMVAALALALSLPRGVLWLAIAALPMIAAYPWMKRITWWPQLFLGLTFNLSALFGWLATGAVLSPAAFALYAACIFWTLGYDTIYAVQDMADDAAVGIKSTARLFATRLRPFVAVCYTLMVLLLALTLQLTPHRPLAYAGIALVAAHVIWQWRALPPAPERAGALFRSNQWLGLMLLAALLAG